MAVLLANNATSKLASSLTAAATTLSVTTGEGAKFPSPTGGDWFPLTLIKSSGALEILRCTARSGDVFTVTRAQEGTAAQAFSAGDRVEVRLTKAVMDAIVQQINDLTNSALLDANNLSDLKNAATARTNLGLGTAATKNAQTSPTDTTAGALMTVGAFGNGRHLDLRDTVFEKGTPADVFVKGMVSGFARGGPDGLNIPVITSNNVFGVLSCFGHWTDGTGGAGSAWREFRTSGGRVYHQDQSYGAWGAWREVFNTGNISSFAQTLLDDADAAAARSTLGISVADGGLGYGQTWQNVTASRASGTTYTNTTGKPIMVSVYSNVFNNNKAQLSAYVDGLNIQVSLNHSNYTGRATVCFIVPAASTYGVASTYTSIAMWAELR